MSDAPKTSAADILKPGGKVMITTPNVKKSLARNPFHVHEYTFDEIKGEISSLTGGYALQGLNGNTVVNTYYEENGKFVRMILKWDIFKLHQKLPSAWLAKPYNLITNMMRNKLKEKVDTTSSSTSPAPNDTLNRAGSIGCFPT